MEQQQTGVIQLSNNNFGELFSKLKDTGLVTTVFLRGSERTFAGRVIDFDSKDLVLRNGNKTDAHVAISEISMILHSPFTDDCSEGKTTWLREPIDLSQNPASHINEGEKPEASRKHKDLKPA